MRTVARETALQIALRNCSKEAGPPDSVCVILVKGGGGVRAITHMFLQKLAASLMGLLLVTRNRPPHGRFSCSSRYEETQETGLIKSSPENICLKVCSVGLSQSTEWFIPDLCPELLPGSVEGQCLQWLVTSFLQNQVERGNFQLLKPKICAERLFFKKYIFFYSSVKRQCLCYMQIFVLYVDAKISLSL